MTNPSAFDKAVSRAGGATAICAQIGVSLQVLNNWRSRGVPPPKCKAFAAATGLSLKTLRPKDWADYWPELRTKA